MPAPDYSVPPIRAGAVPTLDTVATGMTDLQPQPVFLKITTLLTRWLRYHFSAASRIEFPVLINRVWTSDEQSPITITSLAEWNPKNSEQRPAILIDRLDQGKDMDHRIIGDQLQGVQPGYFTDITLGQHVIHCIGGREGEAETLAAEVWRELKRFGPVFRDKVCLMRFLPVKIGRRVQLEEYKEHYTVPISVVYAYQETWKLTVADEEEVTAIRSILS